MGFYDEVKSVPLSSIVSQTVELHATGNNQHRGCCPIHGGDNPNSFLVDDDLNLWYCFSGDCGGGSVIEFLTKTGEAEDAYSAAVIVAESNGIVVPSKSDRPLTTDDLKSACESFCATAEVNASVVDYASPRGLTDDILHRWGIGMLPPTDQILSDLRKENIRIDALEELGFISTSFGTWRVKAQNRLLFPIYHNGSWVGYSARLLPGFKSGNMKAKYINSSNSLIFNKSEIVFGEQNFGAQVETLVIVEGQIDAILLQELTEDSVCCVAVLGSVLTVQQWETISAGCPKLNEVVLLFDNDEGGRKAFLNSFWLGKYPVKITVPKFRVDNIFSEDKSDPADMIAQNVDVVGLLADRVPFDDLILGILAKMQPQAVQDWFNLHQPDFEDSISRDYFLQKLNSFGHSVTQRSFILKIKRKDQELNVFVAPLCRELMRLTPVFRKTIWLRLLESKLLVDFYSFKKTDVDFVENILLGSSAGFESDEDNAKFMAEFIWDHENSHSLVPQLAKICDDDIVAPFLATTPKSVVWDDETTATMWLLFAAVI